MILANPPFKQGDWYDKNTYYQILKVEPSVNGTLERNIKTTLVVAKRGEPCSSSRSANSGNNFFEDEYKIDNATKQKLKGYPRLPCEQNEDVIGAYLPSSGVVFPQGFVKAIGQYSLTDPDVIAGVNNLYEPIRFQLQSRKISQLMAKTWSDYLQAQKGDEWQLFTEGKWDQIQDKSILDGLIAREIFLLDAGYAPDYLEPEDLDIYYPLHPDGCTPKRFVISPDSRAWQGIALSLLMAGQAYYKVTETENETDKQYYYHQISQPILSTGDIVFKYAVTVSWSIFKGVLQELIISPRNNSTVIQITAPYPPIPAESTLDPKYIKMWAEAEDDIPFPPQKNPKDNEKFPFYKKRSEDEYLVEVEYFSPPYPYIPLSCC